MEELEKLKQQWRVKDGKLIHDGDCRFWGKHVCTCGLIHRLMPYRVEEVEKYYPDYYEDLAHHQHHLDHLMRNPPPPLEKMTEEQSREMLRWLEKQFGFVKDEKSE